MSRYKHIIWDWNGTLVNDVRLCVDVLNSICSRRGMGPVTLEYYRANFGFPVIKFYEGLGFDFQKESYEDVALEYITEYNRRRFECSLHPDADAVIRKLADGGVGHSILSAYQQDMLESALEFYGIQEMFTKRVGMTDYYAHSKAQLGSGLIEQLKINPSNIIMVGDTLHDYEVAQALKIDCVLVDHGHQCPSRLVGVGKVINSISQVPGCL